MPKRDRDSDEEEQVTVKVEPGTAPDADAPKDLQEAKEMLKTALDQAAQLAAEKAETEAKLAAEKDERQKEKAQRTIERVHALFESDRCETGKNITSAHMVRNPNLLNAVKEGGEELDWTQEHYSTTGDVPDYWWRYIAVSSWTEVLGYFDKGIGDDENFSRPDNDALANIVVLDNDNGEGKNDYLVLGALTYRCSQKFHRYVYEEKYKTETEALWPQAEKRGNLSESLCLEGKIDVPDSLDPLIAAQPFDATIQNVFLPTDDSGTTGAHFDLDMDKMVAVRRGGGAEMKIFALDFHESYEDDLQ